MHASSRSAASRAAPRGFTSPKPQRGLSIIELLVGIVVSMLVGLAAVGSAMVFNASQRGGIGTGSAMVNGSTVLAAIKADAAQAGLGFYVDDTPLCTSLNFSQGTNKIADGAAFTPVAITRGTDFDQLDIVYASNIEGGTHVLLTAPSSGANAQVGAMLNAAVGNSVLLAPAAAGLCTVKTVTTVAAFTANTPLTLTFASTGANNQANFAATPSYPRDGRAALLGTLRWNRYAVSNGSLQLTQPTTDASGVLLRNVMAFRVQYGVSASASSDTLSEWVDATGSWATLTAANSPRVRAVRVGIILKSTQREKVNASGECEATTNAPALFGSTPSGLIAASDWKCFRYRSFTSVVPLRNLWTGRAQT